MIKFNIQEIINILSILVALIILCFSIYYNERTLKQAEKLNKKTLGQSERNLEIQLLHIDTQEALFELNELLKKEDYFQKFENNIINFLYSFKGQFIQENIKKLIFNELKDMNKFIDEKAPYKEPEPSDEEINKFFERETKDYESLPYEEKFERMFKDRLSFFKMNIEKEIKKKIKKPIK